jgi:hypothetical protein
MLSGSQFLFLNTVVISFSSVIAQLDWAIQKKGTGLSGQAG